MWRASSRVDGAELVELVHGGAVDLLLRVEARPHHPLVGEVEEAPRLVEAQRLGVGQHVERGLARHVHLEQTLLGRATRAPSRPGRSRGRAGWRRSAAGVTKSGRRVSVSVISGRDAGHHAVALVLAVRGVREPLQERVARVMQRARERRVHVDVQRLQPIAVLAGIEDAGQGLGVGQRVGARPQDRRAPRPPSSLGPAPCSPRAATCATRAARRWPRPARRRPRARRATATSITCDGSSGPSPDRLEEVGVEARGRGRPSPSPPPPISRGRVARAHHPVQAMEHDPGQRVHHRREGGHRDDVARQLDRLLLRLARDLLAPLLRRVGREVPDLAQDARACPP